MCHSPDLLRIADCAELESLTLQGTGIGLTLSFLRASASTLKTLTICKLQRDPVDVTTVVELPCLRSEFKILPHVVTGCLFPFQLGLKDLTVLGSDDIFTIQGVVSRAELLETFTFEPNIFLSEPSDSPVYGLSLSNSE